MKAPVAFLVAVAGAVSVSASELIELREAGKDKYQVMADQAELAVLMPDNWQGNLNILSPNKKMCGVNWPHFMLYSQGKWVSDRVESEGLRLLDFKVLKASGPFVAYAGQWSFRDYCITSERHFIWYDATNLTQVHLVKTQLQVRKDLPDISSAWVEFMTEQDTYTQIAAKLKNRGVVTLNLQAPGLNPKADRHYLDGYELADGGWMTIYNARKGQDACAALVPLSHSPGAIHPRIYYSHVDNIEIHILDARKNNFLAKGSTFSLEYLLIVGPDRNDWKWIDPAVENARAFMTNNAVLLESSDVQPN